MLSRLPCVHAQGCCQLCLQSCKTVASAAGRQSCEFHELAYSLRGSCRSHAIKCKFIARLSCVRVAVLRVKCMSASSCISHTNALCVLEQPCHSRAQMNSKENEHSENLVFVVVAAMLP